jgi:hypothetical protein
MPWLTLRTKPWFCRCARAGTARGRQRADHRVELGRGARIVDDDDLVRRLHRRREHRPQAAQRLLHAGVHGDDDVHARRLGVLARVHGGPAGGLEQVLAELFASVADGGAPRAPGGGAQAAASWLRMASPKRPSENIASGLPLDTRSSGCTLRSWRMSSPGSGLRPSRQPQRWKCTRASILDAETSGLLCR